MDAAAVISTLTSLTVGTALFYLCGHSAAFDRFFEKRALSSAIVTDPGEPTGVSQMLSVSVQRLLLIVPFLAGPALGARGLELPAVFGLDDGAVVWTASLTAAVVVLLLLRGIRGRPNLELYPQMSIRSWTPLPVLVNVVGWTGYIAAYEVLFRGYLLSAFLPAGVLVAVAVNTAFYALTHLYKGAVETLLAVPFGIGLCLITIETGSLLPAIGSHLALALGNYFQAVRANPAMSFSR